MDINAALSCVFTIFGGTGDLTHRKLMPALYNLVCENRLSCNFAVVSIGRRDKSTEAYREEVKESIRKYSRFAFQDDKWEELSKKIYYRQMDFLAPASYARLDEELKKLDARYHTKGNRIYYLAVSPEFFAPIVEHLDMQQMVANKDSWQRVVIEKPFGKNLASAQYLNKKITDVFTEKNTYRIDHYLGKEMLQNIMVIRFANLLFEPLWNNRYIDNIQISSSETVGVEDRGGYYEQSGALRDMLQNHMLQLVTLMAMEPPLNLSPESIRDEKVKVLRALKELTPDTVASDVIRGQYGPSVDKEQKIGGYREENRVSADSTTETFVGLKVHIENFRWTGVPFYIRSGKRMPKKSTEIVVQFKESPPILYQKAYKNLQPNLLVIKIQPQEGTFLQFNAKKPGQALEIVPVQMDFCQNCNVENNSPEAYERLLFDVMRGDSTLFTRWDEVEYSWQYVDQIVEAWKKSTPAFPNYEAGTWGPKEADELLQREGRKWWNM